ncbi:MAG: hypothetical protein ACD_58C00131G0019 [uncultured bacterium]|nr:MAG: hypothetical protein ACD_58C00131G0019 [uncultured bacterium]
MKKNSLFLALVVLAILLVPKLTQAAKLYWCSGIVTQTDPPGYSPLQATVGETFTGAICLNTEGQAVDGVDVHYLNYDKTKLEVVGTTITAGSLFASTPANSVDATNGKINFSQVASGGTTYNGSGTLATITFKALAVGNTNLTFDFTSGSTTDSNVAASGSDLLDGVTNGVIKIVAATPDDSSNNPISSNISSSGSSSSNSSTSTDSKATAATSSDSKAKLVSTGPASWAILGLSIAFASFLSAYLYHRRELFKSIKIGKSAKN